MSFSLFTGKLIRFWILHLDWVRLNLFLSCLVMVCLPAKVIVIIASQMFFVAITINIFNKVSFNIGCFKNFLPSSSIPFTIPGAQLKVAGYKKIITFDSGNYLNM